MTTVLLSFAGQWLGLSPEQFREALARGAELTGPPPSTGTPESPPERILDADGMAAATQIPASWFLEQARRGKVPHVRAGKYVRFRLNETLDALAAGARPGDRLSSDGKTDARDQRVTGGCYRAATGKTAGGAFAPGNRMGYTKP